MMAEAAGASQDEAKPLQIIKLGTAAEGYSFTLLEDNLDKVLSKVPSGLKVAVVTVVGAFRTGKSFLLTFLLRYLRYGSDQDDSEAWMTAAGNTIKEGNINEKQASEAASMSFAWRGGEQRTTTGIWMWSEPFVKKIANGEEVAVLLMDTQGMFDNETPMSLTACIFGLSTLLSSYQIYNVQNRIQEDNLQHLALFSEYGRLALAPNTVLISPRPGDSKPPTFEEKKVNEDDDEEEEEKPFQRIEFLVRDWTSFDDESNFPKMRQEMDKYLQDVIEKGSFGDLQQTREQIQSCFEKVRCYMMVHPGNTVTKKNYDGDIKKIDPTFRMMVDKYARQVFGPELEPKRIHGRYLTSPELREYVVSYVTMFKDGTKFPEAKTMLEVTAEANNRNAKFLALNKYKEEMDKLVGPAVTQYTKAQEFLEHHQACHDACMKLFDTRANVGRKKQIKEYRSQLLEEIDAEFERYKVMNANRNPFQNLEYYIVPLVIAFVAFILRWVAETSCSREHRTLCTNVSDAMGHIYVGIFTFIAIISANRIKQGYDHMKHVLPIITGAFLDPKKA